MDKHISSVAYNYFDNKTSQAFGGAFPASFIRTTHSPLDLSSVQPNFSYFTYDLTDQGLSSNFYKGMLVSVTNDDASNASSFNYISNGTTYSTYGPHNDKTGNTGLWYVYGYYRDQDSEHQGTYLADRILTRTETTNILSKNLGISLPGVGEWYQLSRSTDPNDIEIARQYQEGTVDPTNLTYAEIFNDYNQNVATGKYSHAEGCITKAIGKHSHAEGYINEASGVASHVEGRANKASGDYSHAEGVFTLAYGIASHAEGYETGAVNVYEHASGAFNKSYLGQNGETEWTGSKDQTVFTIGNGKDSHNRHNIFDARQSGDIYISDTNAEGEYYEKPMIHLQEALDLAMNSGGSTVKENDFVVTELTIEDYEGELGGSASISASVIELDYSSLVDLRDNSKLVPGTWYRINDYGSEGYDIDNETKFVGNQFDILVLSTLENTLSEIARAIKHEGTTYFDNCNLNAWKIWYCLDNDTDKFDWASAAVSDRSKNRGVIYRMIDEFNNDVSYDFKNIIFARYKVTEEDNVNIGKYYETTGTDKVYRYTFDENNNESNGSPIDSSLKQSNYIFNNEIKSYIEYSKHYLNNIVFFGTNCNDNSFGYICYNNSFGNYCYNNSFGNYCQGNSFGNNYQYNLFDSSCQRNSFGDRCARNSFGTGCQRNSFGGGCENNSLGTNCRYNSFGINCLYNSFGNDCSNNSFGNYCQYNSFENYCQYNSFENRYQGNSFGNFCWENSFGNYCYNNSFGNKCQKIVFGRDKDNLSQYYKNIRIDDGCAGINIFPKETTTSTKFITNIHIHRGVHGGIMNFAGALTINSDNPRLDIEIDTYSQDYEINISFDKNGKLNFTD